MMVLVFTRCFFSISSAPSLPSFEIAAAPVLVGDPETGLLVAVLADGIGGMPPVMAAIGVARVICVNVTLAAQVKWPRICWVEIGDSAQFHMLVGPEGSVRRRG